MKSVIFAAIILWPGAFASSSVQHGSRDGFTHNVGWDSTGVNSTEDVPKRQWAPRGKDVSGSGRQGSPEVASSSREWISRRQDSHDQGSPGVASGNSREWISRRQGSQDSRDSHNPEDASGNSRQWISRRQGSQDRQDSHNPEDASGKSREWTPRTSPASHDHQDTHDREQGSPDDSHSREWIPRSHPPRQDSDHGHDGTPKFEPDWHNPSLNIFESLKDHASRFLQIFGRHPIDVTGRHKFVPPDFEAGDQRGPCPGLNALANHNYIPHDGVVNSFQVIFAMNRVYGVALDLGAILSGLATIWAGVPVSIDPRWSINGTSPKSSNIFHNLLGLAGEPRGITAGHNLLESDSSNTRGDVYETGQVGDNFRLRLPRWVEWYNMSPDPVGDYNLRVMSKRGAKTFEDSKRDNPFFWRGPVSGLIISNGVLALPPALLSNHSRGLDPRGHLTKEVIKSFYGVYGDEPNFEYKEGWERIPNNWYRRPFDYTLVQWLLDGQKVALMSPELFSLGGNTGKVNSFAGLDLSDIFGGAYHSLRLADGNTAICLGLEVLKTLTPTPLSSLYANFVIPIKMIKEAISPVFKGLDCPVVDDLAMGGTPIWDVIRGRFPGAKMAPFAV
ncbi:oxidase [Ophiocordyceps sinensis CO18]|uniref:Oxidase n=1 Tax=Ophiocordyceps sinensis (strain Co18 / CGMCC 3.14243) TaxID=911162 RepID=T5AQG0_OPHSC|nr:oxidase [Ophiocordyceps sinensis CO18]